MRTSVLKRGLLSLLAMMLLTGCQVGYLIENAYYQSDLLIRREPINSVIKNEKTSPTTARKLKLAHAAKVFAETELGLKASKNYTTFTQLDGRYVVHSLTVAKKDQLQPYTWSFPFLGKFPYLGYFNKDSALLAQKRYNEEGYDTYLRGVTAFSTLGWFDDPILSSMLAYSDYNLVNVIIHETVHATIYIKDEVDFNERLATFIGNKGTELFYMKEEGAFSKTLQKTQKESHDDHVFSKFITSEVKALKDWYGKQTKPIAEEVRQARLQEISKSFSAMALPKMKTKSYFWFTKAKLNNARLLSYNTYFKDLSDFEKAYEKLGKNFSKLIEYAKELANAKDPEQALKNFANSQEVSKL